RSVFPGHGALLAANAPECLYSLPLPRRRLYMTSFRRISPARVEQLAERLADRDWAILRSLARVRVLTGIQLDRLHFGDVAASARPRVRRRVLSRLREWRAVTALERRVGGVRAGSVGLIFALDSAGHQVLALEQRTAGEATPTGRVRRPR